MTKTSSAWMALALAPALMGATCDPVDLGRDRDAGNHDAGPTSFDAGTPRSDAGTTDGGTTTGDAGTPPGSSDLRLSARVFFDVFDGGVEHALWVEVSSSLVDPSGSAHTMTPVRLELLDAGGSTLASYTFAPTPTMYRADSSGDRWSASAQIAQREGAAPAIVAERCTGDTFPSRLIDRTVRVVAEIDGVEQTVDWTPTPGAGSFPPTRPFVLCHEGVRLERLIRPVDASFAMYTRRSDGLFDVDLEEQVGWTTYTAATVRSVDPTVRVSPHGGRFFPSLFPTFDATMSAYPCAAGCSVHELTTRWVAGAAQPPMEIAASGARWCDQPIAGAVGSDGSPWPPSAADPSTWECQMASGPITSDNGNGFVRFTGTTDAGPIAVEVFVMSGLWRLGDPAPRP
ncbi:MAG: hypothetical protein AB7S26_29715 [Sandaracinaceae bacterium]